MAAYSPHLCLARARRTSSRRSSSRRAAGSRKRRITRGWPTSGRHSATASRTCAAAPTTGRRRPSRRSTTAGSPVARARPRPISGSPWSSGRGRPTRRSMSSIAYSRRRGRRGCWLSRAWLLAMLDRGEEAWQDALEAEARQQTGHRWGEWWLAELSTLAGDHEDASKRLRVVCDWLEATEQPAFLETYLGRLGRRTVPARPLRRSGAGRRSARDRSKRRSASTRCRTTSGARCWHASTRHRGELAEAERLAREAVAASELTDSLNDQCLALWDLAEVLAAGGPPRRGGSRARAGARTLPAEEEPRAGPPGPRAARRAAGRGT